MEEIRKMVERESDAAQALRPTIFLRLADALQEMENAQENLKIMLLQIALAQENFASQPET